MFIDLPRSASYHAEMERLWILGLMAVLLSSCSRDNQSPTPNDEKPTPASLWLAHDNAVENAKQAGCRYQEGPFIVKAFSISKMADTQPPLQANLDCSHSGALRGKVSSLKLFLGAAEALKSGTTLTAQELALLQTRLLITEELLKRTEPYLVFEPLEGLLTKTFLALEPFGMLKRTRNVLQWELDAFPEVPVSIMREPEKLFKVIKIFTELCEEGRTIRDGSPASVLPLDYAYNLQYACGISEGGWHGVHNLKYFTKIKELEDLGLQLAFTWTTNGQIVSPIFTPKYVSGPQTDEKILDALSQMQTIAEAFFSKDLTKDALPEIINLWDGLDGVHAQMEPMLKFLEGFDPNAANLKEKLSRYTLDKAHEAIQKEEKALTWFTIKKDDEGKLILEKIDVPTKLDLNSHDVLRLHLTNLMNLHDLYRIWMTSMRALQLDLTLPDNQERIQREGLVKELGIRIQKALRIQGTVFEDAAKDRIAPDFELPKLPEPVLPKPQ